MNSWWVHNLYFNAGGMALVSWIFWVIFSITLHELAHGWAAIWQGDNTPRVYGRMTMNPVVHMGWQSLLMFALVGIAWGVMPVDPSRFRWKRRGRIVVSGAGPAMNLLLAFISLTAAAVWLRYGGGSDTLRENVMTFLFSGGMLNLALAGFNLIPVPPLDGSSILMGIWFTAYRIYQKPEVQMYGWFVLMVIFISGVGGIFFAAATLVSEAYIAGLAALLP